MKRRKQVHMEGGTSHTPVLSYSQATKQYEISLLSCHVAEDVDKPKSPDGQSTLKLCKVAQAQTRNITLMTTMLLPMSWNSPYFKKWLLTNLLSWPSKATKPSQSGILQVTAAAGNKTCELVDYQICQPWVRKANLIIYQLIAHDHT